MLTQLYTCTCSHAVNYPSSLYLSNFAHITYSDVILYCAYQRRFALPFWVNDLRKFWSRTNSAPFGREVEKEEWVLTHTCMQGYKVQPNPLLEPLTASVESVHILCLVPRHLDSSPIPRPFQSRSQALPVSFPGPSRLVHRPFQSCSQALPVSFPGPSCLVPRAFLHGSGFWSLAVFLIA